MIRTRSTTAGRELERLLRDGVRPALSDARLLERYILHRDEPAFETLVERHGPMVLSLCRRCLRDPRDVEDAFQATFLVLVRKGSGLRDAGSLSSWLYGVAYRVASRARSDVLKRRSREGEPEKALEAVAPSVAPYDDSIETLDAELSRLPEKYRAPLVLCYLEGRTHEQAAAELGWPVGTVRSRMARGRSLLESRLTRRGLDASACLAVVRPDFLAPSLTWTIPASLVRTTLEGVGRLVGASTIASGGAATLSTNSLSWPATALAQGVLSAMMISQLKWIGLGTAALGLLAATAGMSARAVSPRSANEEGPIAAPKPEPSSEPAPAPRPVPAARPETRTADDLNARLADMERKLDRLTKLMNRLAEIGTPMPPPSPEAASPFEREAPAAVAAPGAPSPSAPAAIAPPAAAPAPEPLPAHSPGAAPALALTPNTAPVPEPLPAPSVRPRAPATREMPVPSAAPYGDVPLAAVEASQPLQALPSPSKESSVNLPAPRMELPAPALTPQPSLVPPTSYAAPVLSGDLTRNGATDALAALVLAPRDRSSVREIEALLQNLYKRQQRNDALREKGAISLDEAVVPTELARVLVARLREMEDEFKAVAEEKEHIQKQLVETREKRDSLHNQLQKPENSRGKERLQEDATSASKRCDSLLDEYYAKERELRNAESRYHSATRLIRWAESHFKDLKAGD